MKPRRTLFGISLVGIVLFSLTGCEEKKSKQSPDVPMADEQTALDPNLGKALAASSAVVPDSKTQPGESDGPPETGVFSPPNADSTHAVGKPIHIEMGIQGTDPRLSLVPSEDGIPKNLTFSVATMMGARSSLPSVDMTFGLAMEKPAKEEQAAPIKVASKLNKIVLSAQQPGQIPKEIADEVAKMKGSSVSWSFEPNGGISISSVARSEKARPELEHKLVAVVETLAAASLAAPAEPVGVGATWIERSRDVYGGLDLISYRMIRVSKIEGDEVTYSVETRQYAAGPRFRKPGLPEGELVQFESTGAGEFVMTRGRRLADKGMMTHTMKFGVHPPDAGPNQIMPLILQSTIKFPADG